MSTTTTPPSDPQAQAPPAPPVTAAKRKYLELLAAIGGPAVPTPRKRAKRDAFWLMYLQGKQIAFGVNHVGLRGYLVPVKIRQQLSTPAPTEGEDVAASTLKGLLDGTIKLTHRKWPACFYADGAYDPSDPQKGLFRSDFLLRITRHIWTAPSSAFHGASSLKRVSNARAAGAFKACPEMVAYSCSQVHLPGTCPHLLLVIVTLSFAAAAPSPSHVEILSGCWTRKDGEYDYVKMFDKVVKLFTDHPTDPWAIETLDWYTKNVFGAHRNGTSSTDGNDVSDDEAINAQRVARVAAASAANTLFPLLIVPPLNNPGLLFVPTSVNNDLDNILSIGDASYFSFIQCTGICLCLSPWTQTLNVHLCLYRIRSCYFLMPNDTP
ncbi:hypothetical protein C8J57DRAFT_1641160 [Mycena rebaudengoi]|nr:hypothetical protein C8J57DRAFT_1641160 [Mycena rebaudengoi]